MAALAVVAALMAELAATQAPEPVVEFIGRAPKLRIYPGGNGDMDSDNNETETWWTWEEVGRRVKRSASRYVEHRCDEVLRILPR